MQDVGGGPGGGPAGGRQRKDNVTHWVTSGVRADGIAGTGFWVLGASTMKKLLKIFAVLLVLGVLAVVVAGFFLGPIVKKAVNTVGPKITGTRVELESAKISPLSGGGTLAGLFVGNPQGWTGDKAFYLGEVRASVQPASLISDCVMVNEVFIDGPEFVYERRLLGGSNIDALIKQIETNTGGGTRQPTTEGESGEPMKFAVKSFRLQNAKVSLMGAGQTITVPLPPLTITDLGVAQGGITADQVATAVLKQVLAQIGVVAADVLVKSGGAFLEGGGKGAEGAKDAAKGAFNKLLGK
ncbi:MAG: hypothetical protein H7067_12700 [Burkholderiales bacterium]|nr:hypothetical protein [Opitutaceae bacterium]